MRYMMGKAGLPQLKTVQRLIPNVGMILSPGGGWQNPTCAYGLDNGVFAAWTSGKLWDQEMHCAWLQMLSKVPREHPPLWVLLPDAVADWSRTVELARLYLPVVRAHGWPVAIALQDGCSFDEALELKPDWVFVAGSTGWKEANIHAATSYFHSHGIRVHVGRVNTKRRLILCQSANVDSVDGTTLNKFLDQSLTLIQETLKQTCLHI